MRTLYICMSLLISSYMIHGMENISDSTGSVSDLLAACAIADLEGVKELVESGVSVNCKNRYGFTPLHVAVTRGVETEFINLYNHPVPLPGNHAAVVRYLLTKGADVKARSLAWGGCNSLFWAARFGTVKILKLLIQSGADLESRHADNNSTPLHQAARSWDFNNIRFLVGAGADIDAVDNSDRKPADVAALKFFCNYLNDVAPQTQKLFKALNAKDEVTAKDALLQRADIFVADRWGDTPLHIAIRNELPVAARMLVTMGANISRKNYSGERPFCMLVHFWFNEIFSTAPVESAEVESSSKHN